MKYEIGFMKNDVPQARIVVGPDADTCAAYFKATEPEATYYGIHEAGFVKPGQPVDTVPDGWTAPTTEPAEDAAEPDYNVDHWQDLRHVSATGGQLWTGRDAAGRYYLASRPDYYTGDDVDASYYDTATERDDAAAAILAEYGEDLAEDTAEPAEGALYNTMACELQHFTARSAWERGVAVYAEELLDELEWNWDDEPWNEKELNRRLLNGADDWTQYSWGGCSLIYDQDIAARLCTPSELKRTRNGERRPNSREEWLDTQARALGQAARRVTMAYRQAVKGVQA